MKNTFAPKTFGANTFACGTFRGLGVAPVAAPFIGGSEDEGFIYHLERKVAEDKLKLKEKQAREEEAIRLRPIHATARPSRSRVRLFTYPATSTASNTGLVDATRLTITASATGHGDGVCTPRTTGMDLRQYLRQRLSEYQAFQAGQKQGRKKLEEELLLLDLL